MTDHEFEDEDEFLEKLMKAMSEPVNTDEPALGHWGCIFIVKVPESETIVSDSSDAGLFMIPEDLEFPDV